jgi:hypothetical protein
MTDPGSPKELLNVSYASVLTFLSRAQADGAGGAPMGKRPSPTMVGAIAMVAVGILVFGSIRMFKHTVKFVCFFPHAVDGLNVGAPVRFK